MENSCAVRVSIQRPQVEEEKNRSRLTGQVNSRRKDRKQIKRLESELRRKKKVLAETAVLLMLSI